MKTVEGFNVTNATAFELHTAIYDKSVKSYDIKENGLSGFVINTQLDDRFVVREFCIWNKNGDCVYVSTFGGVNWGLRKHYKISQNNG